MLRGSGRKQQAVSAFREAADADPTNGDAWNNLGMLLKDLGQFGEARKVFLELLKREPDNKQAGRILAGLMLLDRSGS